MIPAARNIKKSLKVSEIEKIISYETSKGTTEEFARDIWIFSYLNNGMNIADIARIKYSNIEDNKIIFYREKTRRTSRQNLKPIIAIILPVTTDIIARWGNKPESPEKYIFPIIKSENPEKQRADIKQFTKIVNKYIKRIAKNVGIEKNVTSYYARHSFSNILKQSGASDEFIGESLGHSDRQTTENYLDSFEDDIKNEWASKLLDFNKK